MKQFLITSFMILAIAILMLVDATPMQLSTISKRETTPKSNDTKPQHDSTHHMLHNHLSRKVFDRACAASKDTIEEIIGCLTSNEHLTKAVNPETAAQCFKDAYGQAFDHKDMFKHKEMICKNRDKFEAMTTCIYRKTVEASDPKDIEKLSESMVDVGLCIINALDG